MCKKKKSVLFIFWKNTQDRCAFPSAYQSGTIFRFRHWTQITHNITLIKAFVLFTVTVPYKYFHSAPPNIPSLMHLLLLDDPSQHRADSQIDRADCAGFS